ncbi:MAG: hypothetical protein NC116_11990 [Clostridium sp.]|nr:hypothetical protein [Clostridium sp.]
MIEPNSTVRFHAFTPLDATYENTIWFPDKDTQTQYFTSTADVTFSKLQYVRPGRGMIKLPVKPDVGYTYNYMSFQNTNYGSKWFYAFITQVDYVNDNTTLFTFELDYIQSYIFDFVMPMCFVEREHSVNDEIGENFQGEPFDIGDMKCDFASKDDVLNNYVAVIASSAQLNLDGTKTTAAGVYGGMLQGVDLLPTVRITNTNYSQAVSNFKSIIDSYVNKNAVDSIINVFVMPEAFMTYQGEQMKTHDVSINKPTTNGSYEPKNNKLLQFPYMYLAVDSGSNCANFRYEWFGDSKCNFRMYGTYSCNPEVSLMPMNYNGLIYDMPDQLKITGFGQLAFAVDSYKAWLAQNAEGYNLRLQSAQLAAGPSPVLSPLGINASAAQVNAAGNILSAGAGSVGQIGAGMAGAGNVGQAVQSIGNLITTGINSVHSVLQSEIGLAQVQNEKAMAQNQPPHARGQQQTLLDVVLGRKGYYFKRMCMQESYLRVADDFLSLYGYATNRVKVPNISSRPHWNYVKTSGMSISGAIPQFAAVKLEEIFNSGVRFWKYPNEIGDYSLDNRAHGMGEKPIG